MNERKTIEAVTERRDGARKTVNDHRCEEWPLVEIVPPRSGNISSEGAVSLLNELQMLLPDNATALFHKLRAYQIELQLQNEELRTAQAALEMSREKYSNLFDLAPMGYLVMDGDGVIQEVNSTGAGMLAVEKSNLAKQKFSSFVLPEYQDAFYFHREKVFKTGERQCCEVKLLQKTGASFCAQLDSIIAPESKEDARRFLSTITDISEGGRAAAIERARRKIRFLTSYLLTVQDDERKRIAFELHDDLGQSLVLLKLRLKNAETLVPATSSELKSECKSLGHLASGMIDTVRKISSGLAPCAHDDFSLTESLRLLIKDFVRNAGLSISVKMENVDGLFSPITAVAIYRIFQEALTNAVKHADADHISIEAHKKKDGVLFQVKDQGIGFDVKKIKTGVFDEHAGMGLTSMKERVLMLKGHFQLESRLFKGTQITFRIPFEPAAPALQ